MVKWCVAGCYLFRNNRVWDAVFRACSHCPLVALWCQRHRPLSASSVSTTLAPLEFRCPASGHPPAHVGSCQSAKLLLAPSFSFLRPAHSRQGHGRALLAGYVDVSHRFLCGALAGLGLKDVGCLLLPVQEQKAWDATCKRGRRSDQL